MLVHHRLIIMYFCNLCDRLFFINYKLHTLPSLSQGKFKKPSDAILILQIHSENITPEGASPLLAKLTETCKRIGKNIGSTNQSLSESLVAQTIILDEEKRRYQQQLDLQYQDQTITGISTQSHVNNLPPGVQVYI